MRIKVINPNTTAGMTAKIGEAARGVAAPGTEILAVNPAAGPVSIESHYDEAVSVLGVLEEVRKGEAEGCDGYVIACFGDPGLLAAREIATGRWSASPRRRCTRRASSPPASRSSPR